MPHKLKEWEEPPIRFGLVTLLFFTVTDLIGSRWIGNSGLELQNATFILRSVQLIGLLILIRYFRLFDTLGWHKPNRRTLQTVAICGIASLGAALLLIAIWPEAALTFRLQGYLYGVGGMLLMLVIAPLVEEIVFRGVLYRMLRSAFGSYAAITVSALLFALMHGSIMLPQFVGGLIFATAYKWSGNLWAPILLHSSGNLLIWTGLLSSF